VLVGQIAPQLLAEPGCGPLIAAKLVGEIAGAQRFATAAKLARAAGVAPIPASSPATRSASDSTRAATARSTPRFTA
jgi:transposase